MNYTKKAEILQKSYKEYKPNIQKAYEEWQTSEEKKLYEDSSLSGGMDFLPYQAFYQQAGELMRGFHMPEMQMRSKFNSFTGGMYALNQWVRHGKEIFNFEEALSEQLQKDARDFDVDKPIPIKVIDSMPGQGFFISLPPTKLIGRFYMDGFFVNRGVTFHEEAPKVTESVSFTAVMFENYQIFQTFTLSMPVNLEGIITVQDALNKMMEYSSMRRREEGGSGRQKRTERALKIFLEYLLYVCAENAEIRVINVVEKGKGESKVKRRTPQIYEVGEKEGMRIRKYRDTRYVYSHEDSPENKREMAPHMRRSHWHSYWTGKKDEEKKLILRWLPPIYIHPEKMEDARVTVTELD